MGLQYDIFIHILNMSVTATYMVLFVCILRLFLKKTPKIFSYVLWSAVLFRLISPYSFSSALNIIGRFGPIMDMGNSTGRMEYIPYEIGYAREPQVNVGITSINNVINHMLPEAIPYASINPMQVYLFLGSLLWLLVITLLIGYGVTSYLYLKSRMNTAMLLRDNIYESEKISTPFVLGFVRPKIYLPLAIKEEERDYIIRHEQVHIKRLDHLIKPFAFLVLAVHWFNPVIWFAYFLMSKDMEMSCDERVLREYDYKIKKEYGSSLLRLATKQRILCGVPLAFGESNTKARIKNVISYRKPAFWISIGGILVCVIGIFLVISNPKVPNTKHDEIEELAKALMSHKTGGYMVHYSGVDDLIKLVEAPNGTSLYEMVLSSDEIILEYQMVDELYSPNQYEFIRDTVLLFATISNIDMISHVGKWKNEEISPHSFNYVYTRENIDQMIGKDVRVYSNNQKDMVELITMANDMILNNVVSDYITRFTHYSEGNSIGITEIHNSEVATGLASLLLSGEEEGKLINYEIPEISEYIKIEIGVGTDRIYYIYEEEDSYYTMVGNDYKREIPEESYEAIINLFTAVAVEAN